VLEDHPDCPLADLLGIPACACHDSILSRNGASGKPRAVHRVLVIGELVGRSGQDTTSALKLIERTLIEYATLEGYELINQMGTRPPTHTISFSGSRVARSWLLPRFTVTRPRRARRGE